MELLPSAADMRLLPDARMGRAMPWLIGIMTLLMVLSAAAGIGMFNAANSLSHQLANRLTVQIVDANPASRARQVNDVLRGLRHLSIVSDVQAVNDDHMRQLLVPWLGEDAMNGVLPIPALIDVTLAGDGVDHAEEIEATIKSAAPTAKIEAHSQWLAPLQSLLTSLEWLAILVIFLTGAALAAAVVLTVRAALNTHRTTLDIMHLMGASDIYVAQLFQRRVAFDASAGVLAGFTLGALTATLLAAQLRAVGAAILDAGGLGWTDYVMICAIPLSAIALSIITTRQTVLRTLGKLL